MNATVVLSRLETYVRENFLYAQPDFQLTPDQPLIGNGIVDSMGIMEIIAYIDDEFGVTFADNEITEPNLRSLSAMTNFIMARQGVASPESNAA